MWSMSVRFSLLLALSSYAQKKKEEDRPQQSYSRSKEILGTPDKGIPRDSLDNAECVADYPTVKKAGFILGGEYKRGAITCRSGENFNGLWSVPLCLRWKAAVSALRSAGRLRTLSTWS